MKLYWKKESPEAWIHFRQYNIVDEEMNSKYPESLEFMRNFHERHIPIKEDSLENWAKEADICGSTYGAMLRQDIKWARKCNERNDEVLIFNEPTIE